MNLILLFLALSLLIANFWIRSLSNDKRATKQSLKADFTKLPANSSLPFDYGYCYVLWNLLIGSAIFFLPLLVIQKSVFLFAILVANFFYLRFLRQKNFNVKKHCEKIHIAILSLAAILGIVITLVITASILVEAVKFFKLVSPLEFFFGTNWQPQMAMTAEQEVGQSSFGIVPVFLGTLLITLIAMAVAFPIGIMAAIYLANYAKTSTRNWLKPTIEILAGVPTVVYGYFAVIAVAPLFKKFFTSLGLEISSESALAAGFVMGIMIIPFVLSLADDAFNSVPQSLKDGALALGSTKSEVIKKVVLPTAMPGLIAAIILAVSRAIGETMIVVMAAGLVANLTFNPLSSVTTATAQIVTLLTGDQEFNSPKTLSAFALALSLFVLTFILNSIALSVSKFFKKKYG